jgi:glycosyltransferase involved in cell wall biosynthesis
MNILHLATGKSGGARLAAKRLAHVQEKFGDSVVLIPPIYSEPRRSFSSKVIDLSGKVTTLAQGALTVPPYGLVSTFSISKMRRYELELEQFDIIHVHNWFNLLSLGDFQSFSKEIPIVFTLHDERLLTGGCHYTFDCKNYLDGCLSCPAVRLGKNSIRKNHTKAGKIFEGMNNYGVISPSSWLLAKAYNSKLMRNAKISTVIPNVTNLPYPSNLKPSGSNTRLEKSILFVAADVNQRIKGFDLLISALSRVNLVVPGFTLHIVGNGTSLPELDFPHVYHGYLDEIELKKLMAQTLICIIPSILDNSPSVAIEAIAGGNVLIVNDVGGLTELVEDGETGFKSVPDPEKMSEVISKVLQMDGAALDAIRTKSLQKIEFNYSDESIFRRHNEFYTSVCEQVN